MRKVKYLAHSASLLSGLNKLFYQESERNFENRKECKCDCMLSYQVAGSACSLAGRQNGLAYSSRGDMGVLGQWKHSWTVGTGNRRCKSWCSRPCQVQTAFVRTLLRIVTVDTSHEIVAGNRVSEMIHFMSSRLLNLNFIVTVGQRPPQHTVLHHQTLASSVSASADPVIQIGM